MSHWKGSGLPVLDENDGGTHGHRVVELCSCCFSAAEKETRLNEAPLIWNIKCSTATRLSPLKHELCRCWPAFTAQHLDSLRWEAVSVSCLCVKVQLCYAVFTFCVFVVDRQPTHVHFSFCVSTGSSGSALSHSASQGECTRVHRHTTRLSHTSLIVLLDGIAHR